MKKKLTLSINDDLIDFAHDFSKETHQSISHIVEEYLAELKKQQEKGTKEQKLNKRIENFQFDKLKITNFEMESSAIYGLSKMLGHNALTVCLIIANRVNRQVNENYRDEMKKLIIKVLDSLTN